MSKKDYSTAQKKPDREANANGYRTDTEQVREREQNGYRMDTEQISNGYGTVTDQNNYKSILWNANYSIIERILQNTCYTVVSHAI